MSRHARPVLFSLVLLAVLTGLVRSGHRHVEAWAPREVATESVRFLPSGKALGAVSLGYEELLADLLWLRATTLFGERFGQDGDLGWYAWLYHMMDLATDLDPAFRAAYKYGGIMLRVDGSFTEQSTMIFAKGMHALPDEWYFPFGIGMNYYMHKDNPVMAAPYMRRAATLPGAPFYLANLAASLMDTSHGLETSLQFLQEEARNLPDPRARRAVEVKIFEVRYQIAARDAERVIAEYRRTQGQLPREPAAVSEAGLALPADPLGGVWEWNRASDAQLGSVRSSEYYRAFRKLSRDSGLGVLGTDLGTEAGEDTAPVRP